MEVKIFIPRDIIKYIEERAGREVERHELASIVSGIFNNAFDPELEMDDTDTIIDNVIEESDED